MSGSSDGLFVPASPDPAVSPFSATNPSGNNEKKSNGNWDETLANISSSDNDVSDSDRTKTNRNTTNTSTQSTTSTSIRPTTMNNTNDNTTGGHKQRFSFVDKFYPTNNNNNNNSNKTSSPKKRQPTASSTEEDKENKRQRKENVNDEGTQCTICFESWKTSGLHRSCCLKCGHLFGKSCLEKWLKEKRKCPTCSAKARPQDIRVLFINKVSAVDPEEVEKVKRNEEELKKKLKEQQKAYDLLLKKYNKAKAQLEKAQFMSSHTPPQPPLVVQSRTPFTDSFFGACNASKNTKNANNFSNNNNNKITNPTNNIISPNKTIQDSSNSNKPSDPPSSNNSANNNSHNNSNSNSNNLTDATTTPSRPTVRSSSTFTFGSTSFHVNPHSPRQPVNSHPPPLPPSSSRNHSNSVAVYNNNSNNGNNNNHGNSNANSTTNRNNNVYSHSQPVNSTHPTQPNFSSFGFATHSPNSNKMVIKPDFSPKPKTADSPNKIVPSENIYKLTYTVPTQESRVVEFCSDLALLLVSHTKLGSPNRSQGILKISGLDPSSNDFVPDVHSKQIRDMKINATQPLALTVSLDKTLKVLFPAFVMEYPLECPGWSCAWGEGTTIYCGQANGTVCLFDTRMPRPEPIVKVSVPHKPLPVHSLAYFCDPQDSLTPSQKGVVCGSVGGICFMEGSSLNAHVVPLEGACSSVSYDAETQACLASFRSTPTFTKPSHVVFKHQGMGAVTEIRTLHSTSPQTLLSRSTMFQHPAPQGKPRLLTAASDEDKKQVVLWDVSTGAELQKLPPQAYPTIDIKHFRHQQSNFLATLTECSLYVHNWK